MGSHNVERMEPRRFLSAVLSPAGDVIVTGTESADTIAIARVSTNSNKYAVSVNGTVTTFDVVAVQRFRVSTLGGDDTIAIDPTFGVVPVSRFVACGGGNDTYHGSQGRDIVEGGAGDDVITGGTGRDILTGQIGNDTISGGADSDFVGGGAGDDWLIGSFGDDTLEGHAGNDNLSGGDQVDSLTGGAGDDTLIGSRGRDFCIGDEGRDTIDGGAQADFLYGGDGDDTISGAGGNDIVAGDSENRLFPNRPIAQHVGNDIISGGVGDDILLSRNGSDTLTGGDGDDRFDARGDDDVLTDRQAGEVRPVEQFLPGPVNFTREIDLTINVDLEDTGRTEEMYIRTGTGAIEDETSIAFAVNDTGDIRFSSDTGPRDFTLGEFFQAWGVTFDPDHIGQHVINGAQRVTMTVNGVANTDFQNYVIQEDDQIVITFV
ncbi:MAG: calcium-binding protein [Tepidisphaeraceae bacterium]